MRKMKDKKVLWKIKDIIMGWLLTLDPATIYATLTFDQGYLGAQIELGDVRRCKQHVRDEIFRMQQLSIKNI